MAAIELRKRILKWWSALDSASHNHVKQIIIDRVLTDQEYATRNPHPFSALCLVQGPCSTFDCQSYIRSRQDGDTQRSMARSVRICLQMLQQCHDQSP